MNKKIMTLYLSVGIMSLSGFDAGAAAKTEKGTTHSAKEAVEVSPLKQQPNVLFIFADDMSYETIGAYGMLDIDTPNLDTLVERGVTFTHAYNMGAWGGAVCVASRAMLNTGRFVWQAQTADIDKYVRDNRMWSQRMKQAGYRTYMTGKWHVHTDASGIFDVVKHVRGGMPKQTPEGYNRPKSRKDYAAGWKPWEKKYGGFWEGGTHWSVVGANDGIDFLKTAAADEKPFFMYVAFNAPHDPRQAPKEYIDRYPLERIKLPENALPQYPYAKTICGLTLRDEKLMPYPRTEYAVKVNRQEYFALITHMDEQIGRILDALEKTGKADNTYIIFTADNGLAVGHHGLVGKQNMYDHSVRVPFMVVGPGVKAGSKIDEAIYLQDAMATALELAGANRDGVDFKSLLPLLKGESTKHYDEIYGAYMDKQRMITKGDWKLISYPTIRVQRLFNLKKDPNEMDDLSSNPEYGPKLREMRKALAGLSKGLDDPLLLGGKSADWNFTPDPALPNVLILGDSISMGYTLPVRKLLKGKANVFRPMEGEKRLNCYGTNYGVANLDTWLAGRSWAVIHFNWGLHDLKHVKAPGADENSNDPNDPQQATLEQYAENMKVIVEKLKATGARLVFATTTPVAPGTLKPLRTPEEPERYNAAALKIMKANHIRVNDLYAFTLPHQDKWQRPQNVHYYDVGNNAMGKQVAAVIAEELAKQTVEQEQQKPSR